MATYTTYTFDGGTEIKLKLSSDRTIELEEKLGDSIPKKLSELEKLSIAAEFITAAIVDGEYPARKQTALTIYDDMIEHGKKYRDYMYLIYEVLTKAGFIEGGTVEKQRETDEAQAKLEKLYHKAQIELISQKIEKIQNSENITASQS